MPNSAAVPRTALSFETTIHSHPKSPSSAWRIPSSAHATRIGTLGMWSIPRMPGVSTWSGAHNLITLSTR